MDSKVQRHIDRAQALVEEFGGGGKKRLRPIKLTKIKIKYTPRIRVAELIKGKKRAGVLIEPVLMEGKGKSENGDKRKAFKDSVSASLSQSRFSYLDVDDVDIKLSYAKEGHDKLGKAVFHCYTSEEISPYQKHEIEEILESAFEQAVYARNNNTYKYFFNREEFSSAVPSLFTKPFRDILPSPSEPRIKLRKIKIKYTPRIEVANLIKKKKRAGVLIEPVLMHGEGKNEEGRKTKGFEDFVIASLSEPRFSYIDAGDVDVTLSYEEEGHDKLGKAVFHFYTSEEISHHEKVRIEGILEEGFEKAVYARNNNTYKYFFNREELSSNFSIPPPLPRFV